jgi:hypothetical protein
LYLFIFFDLLFSSAHLPKVGSSRGSGFGSSANSKGSSAVSGVNSSKGGSQVSLLTKYFV